MKEKILSFDDGHDEHDDIDDLRGEDMEELEYDEEEH